MNKINIKYIIIVYILLLVSFYLVKNILFKKEGNIENKELIKIEKSKLKNTDILQILNK